MQVDRRLVDRGHGHASHVVEVGGASDVAYEVLAGVLLGETAAGIDSELGKGLFQLFVGDAKRAQRSRVRRYAVLPNFSADRNDLSHPGNAQEPRAND